MSVGVRGVEELEAPFGGPVDEKSGARDAPFDDFASFSCEFLVPVLVVGVEVPSKNAVGEGFVFLEEGFCLAFLWCVDVDNLQA